MTNASPNPSLLQAIISFNAILGIDGRHFGAVNGDYEGVSDDNKGVQWNIRCEKASGIVELGVNLEGMTYSYWPIAVFIENEMKYARLLELAPTLAGTEDISVAFYRDAWQFASRPRIEEEFISGTPVKLNHFTEAGWMATLAEAYTCLDASRGRRGRGTQTVTLRTRGKREMDVSPHLHISTPVWMTTPCTSEQARRKIEAGFRLLQPIYAIVKSQSTQ